MSIQTKLKEISDKFDEKFNNDKQRIFLVPNISGEFKCWTIENVTEELKSFLLTSSHELLEENCREIEGLKIETMIERNAGIHSATEIIKKAIQCTSQK